MSTSPKSQDGRECGPSITTTTRFAMVGLSRSSRVRLLDFPETINRSLEPVLHKSWPPGIKSEQWTKGAFEYTLREKPWGLFGSTAGACSHYLLRDILQHLYDNGWVLATPITSIAAPEPCDSLLFRHAEKSPPPATFMAVQIHGASKLDLHGACADTIAEFRQMLQRLGLFESDAPFHDSHSFKVVHKVWWNIEENVMRMRRLILGTAELMETLGWSTYGTIRQRASSKDVRVTDSWYFIRAVGERAM
ncbi:hypothetical protein Micbo1qcDRAFT_33473 [Microdochium bolleyi]|uniref:Uncharacterized protein n=1 Tax=Microdochium bolleyi TaxID=196109 RepID=A0A136IPY2_9PEZI|nr:hypothetical protein Micbo1qcDRAFT_33473 [Microdochium bolleyi]